MGTGSKWGRTFMLGLYHFSIAHINVVTSTNFVADGKGDLHHLCLASYRFPDGHMPKAEPHGNAKSDQAFHPTGSSVIVRMKSQSQQFGPKETVSRVSQEAGGIVGAAAPGKLPRNEYQVSNLRHSQKQPSDSSNDELLTVMSQCKSKDVTAHFIRDVKALSVLKAWVGLGQPGSARATYYCYARRI